MYTERERFEEVSKKIKRESSDAFLQFVNIHHHHHKINTITPCAACKLLRRRCAQECPFSPYFSPHEPHKFASVHKVFGASNVSKMLMEVPESQRADAANSLVYEANVRLRDPVYGCMGAISALQQQVKLLQAELNHVRAEVFKYNNNYCRESTAISNSSSSSSSNMQILPYSCNNYSHLTSSILLSSGAVSITLPPPPEQLPPPPPQLPPGATSNASDDQYSNNSKENMNYFG